MDLSHGLMGISEQACKIRKNKHLTSKQKWELKENFAKTNTKKLKMCRGEFCLVLFCFDIIQCINNTLNKFIDEKFSSIALELSDDDDDGKDTSQKSVREKWVTPAPVDRKKPDAPNNRKRKRENDDDNKDKSSSGDNNRADDDDNERDMAKKAKVVSEDLATVVKDTDDRGDDKADDEKGAVEKTETVIDNVERTAAVVKDMNDRGDDKVDDEKGAVETIVNNEEHTAAVMKDTDDRDNDKADDEKGAVEKTETVVDNVERTAAVVKDRDSDGDDEKEKPEKIDIVKKPDQTVATQDIVE